MDASRAQQQQTALGFAERHCGTVYCVPVGRQQVDRLWLEGLLSHSQKIELKCLVTRPETESEWVIVSARVRWDIARVYQVQEHSLSLCLSFGYRNDQPH